MPSSNPAGPPTLFLNRELSWLEFNARVLAEAFDERNPLLERLKFLSIFSTNLDEFYMVRVAGLRRQVAARVQQTPPDGLTAREQLDAIERRVGDLLEQARRCLHELLLPALEARGVRLLTMAELGAAEREAMDAFFETHVFPVLTPLAVDPGHPFPYISNLSISLAVQLREPEHGNEHFARVKVPKSLTRWVPVEGRPNHFVPLEQVIGAHLGALFPGMQILGSHTFRITRYSDLEIANSEEPEDLLAMIEEQVFQRRFGEVVRLELQDDMPAALRALLLDELRDTEDPEITPLTDREVHTPGPLLDLGDLMALTSLDVPELKDPPFVPVVPAELRDADRPIFDVIRERDVLVHHPFDSFSASVEQFIEAAARDEQTLAIKMTLYRTGGGAVVRALTEAAQRGIQVAVLVELQARFEETNNINFARTLESFGVHVAYGIQGLKTHCKVALVVRREPDGIRRYVHISTRQLQRQDRPRVHGHRPLHVQRGAWRGRQRPVQPADRVLAPARVPQADRGAARHARALPAARGAGSGARSRGAASAHHREDELARGRRDDRGAVSRVAGRRGNRPHRSRHLLPAAAARGRVGSHPRDQHRRAVPRAFAALVFRQRFASPSTTSAPRTGCRATSTGAWSAPCRWRTRGCIRG